MPWAQALMPSAVPAAIKVVERKELQKLKKTVDRYQSEIEGLKKKVEKQEKAEVKAEERVKKAEVKAEERVKKAEDALASQKKPKRCLDKEAAVSVPTRIIQHRPRAKATAANSLKKKKLIQRQQKVRVLSRDQKLALQVKIDQLNDDQFDKVLQFLEPELGNPNDDEIQLDIDTLSPERQHALVSMVQEELFKLMCTASVSGNASS